MRWVEGRLPDISMLTYSEPMDICSSLEKEDVASWKWERKMREEQTLKNYIESTNAEVKTIPLRQMDL